MSSSQTKCIYRERAEGWALCPLRATVRLLTERWEYELCAGHAEHVLDRFPRGTFTTERITK